MPPSVKAFVLAAGLGTRLKPLTDLVPKCLVPIAGIPLLDYWVDQIAEAGIFEVRVNTHAHADQVRDYIREVNRSGRLHLTESYEPTLLGSAGTISANSDFADDATEIILIYADNLSDVNLSQMLAFHRSHGDPFTILLFRAPIPQACGIVELDETGRVVSFEEKPKQPRGDLANGGIYIVNAEAYREMAALKAFDLGSDVLPRFVGRMRGWKFEGYHRDIGTHEALLEAQSEGPRLFLSSGSVLEDDGDTDMRADANRRGISKNRIRRPAVFLDRDGTLIEHVHYLADPTQVHLVPDGAESVRRLSNAGYACILVTNQSAIGHGLITESDLELIHQEMNRQLKAEGAELDAIYFCPVVGLGSNRTSIEHPDRKPGPGMLLRAASEHCLDLSESWMVGDMTSDVLAGNNAGCRGSILVGTDSQLDLQTCSYHVASNLTEATDLVLAMKMMPVESDLISESRR